MGALVKMEEHAHNVGTCYRCGTTVEPIVSEQWFVSMEPLGRACNRSGTQRKGQVCTGTVFQNLF